MTTGKLAILVNQPGTLSATFVRRHVNELLPGRTVVVASHPPDAAPAWMPEGPLLYASRRDEGFARKVGVKLRMAPSPTADRVRAFLREHGVEAIMGEFLDYSYQWFRFLERDFRFYVHAHGYDVSEKLREAKWRRRYRAYARAAGIITINEPSRQALIRLGIPPEKLHVYPCGVDVAPECPERVESQALRCLAVGRMVGKKAPVLTMRAFARAIERSGANAVLDFVGDGPMLEEVRAFVAAANLHDRVVLHGAQPHEFVKARMAACDVYVQHSRVDPQTGDMEGLPVAILEAMAAGAPVVSTRHAGIPEAVEDGTTGLLVEEGDWEGMGEALAGLLVDGARRRAMGEAGWRRARERFSWERERAGLLEVMGL